MATTPTAPHIPEDIVVGNILHRFPVKSLFRFSCVCKHWYNKIHDPDFLHTHSLHSRKNPRLLFRFKIPIPTLSPILPDIVLLRILSRLPIKSLRRFRCVSKLWLILTKDEDFIIAHRLTQNQNILTLFDPMIPILDKFSDLMHVFSASTSHFFYLENNDATSGGLCKIGTRSYYYGSDQKYKIGNCNGLVCFRLVQGHNLIEICNPSRREILTISSQSLLYPAALLSRFGFGFGFGFDSVKEEYKVVGFVRDLDYNNYKCLVFTLGTNLWREIHIPSPKVSDLVRRIHMSSIFCDGALFWQTGPEAELVMFDLHHEKFQVIQFPEGFDSTTSCYRQLELNGYLCFARWEDEDVEGSKNNYKEVHLYILKDKTEPIWFKESFLLPFVTRRCELMMDFSGQVLMYWSDGERVHVYNLQTKDRKIIQPHGGLHHEECSITSHVENFLSLKTFAREGAHGTFCIANFYPH